MTTKWRTADELDRLAKRLRKQAKLRDDTGQCVMPSRMVKHLLEVIAQAEHTERAHEEPAMTPANKDRADWAQSALAYWQADINPAKLREIDMGDFLADLMHLCDARGWNFNDLVKTARLRHHFETKGGKDA